MQCQCPQLEFSLRFISCYLKLSEVYTLQVNEVNAWQETCLASKDALPFELLKKKLMLRLDTLGVRIVKTYEEVLYSLGSCSYF